MEHIQAVYLTPFYEPSTGAIELKSIQEGYQLLGVEESDILVLPLPNRAKMYMVNSLQREKSKDQVNQGASLIARSAGLANMCVWGPVLVVKAPERTLHHETSRDRVLVSSANT